MPSLATNASISLSLSVGQVVEVSAGSQGVATVSGFSGGNASQGLGPGESVVGPFNEVRTVSLTCLSGTMQYLQKSTVDGDDLVIVSASDVASPTPDMLADTKAVYQLNVAPFTRYQSDGASLVALGVGGSSSGVETGYTSAGTGIALTADHLQYHDIWRVIGSGNVVLDASVAQDGKPRFFIPDGANSFTLVAHTNFEPGDWVVSTGATASSAEAVGGMVSIVALNNGEVHVVSPKSMAGLTVVEATPYVNMTATGTAVSGACELAGYDCTTAAGNITIYDGTSAAGVVIVPTTALSVGRVEFAYKRALNTGCHVVLSGAATVNVLVG